MAVTKQLVVPNGLGNSTPDKVVQGNTFTSDTGLLQTGTHVCAVDLERCKNITVTSKSDGIEIMWTDPEDIYFHDDLTAQWKGTKLVRKTGDYPTSVTDGTLVLDSKTRNAYSATPFKDTGVVADTMYYYCLFPYTDKAVSKNDENRFSAELILYLPVLADNSWKQIAKVSEIGIASQIWNIGDEINLQLSGGFNETVTLQIWDFNHFDKSDGSGKAGICFGMKNLMAVTKRMNSSNTNVGGWNNTEMCNTVMQQVLNSMPAELKAVLKEVSTYASKGEGDTSGSVGKLCADKVFLPGLSELDDSWSAQNKTETNQKKFPIFTDSNSRIKRLRNGSGSADYYWTRSPNHYNNYGFCNVNNSGNTYDSVVSSSEYGVCFCFNV